ncbi:MAG: tRNA uridine-5-carboxymethylaminomethyl(34) synthesis GTPase MnmE [Leptospirillia bacterium]
MGDLTDTICSPATAPGEGAIGIVRVSGAHAVVRVTGHFRASDKTPLTEAPSHTVHHGHVVDADGNPVDEVLVILMRAPRSYTREDVVEVQCHGGAAALEAVLAVLVAAGCRMAEPGEFTRRAFLNGRIDLAQAESVLEVIGARTEAAYRIAQRQMSGALTRPSEAVAEALKALAAHLEAAIDFPEDDLEDTVPEDTLKRLEQATFALSDILRRARAGHLLKEGIRLAIVGRPNVGKSSLLNRLVGYDRAIVAAAAGTTRDVVEAEVAVDGVRFVVQDTAGIRDTDDVVEAEGVRRSRSTAADADVTLLVLDGSLPESPEDAALLAGATARNTVVALNKSDLNHDRSANLPEGLAAVRVSALTGDGLDALRDALLHAAVGNDAPLLEHAFLVTSRQRDALERAHQAALTALSGVRQGRFAELVATDVRSALDAVGEVTGKTSTDDLLNTIFSRFCIGK